MGWASHPTAEMPTESPASQGRHRARSGLVATVVSAVGLAALVAVAMLAPTLIGLPPPAEGLRLDPSLAVAARAHSIEMARTGLFGHSGADGIDPGERMRRAGYDTGRGWAENARDRGWRRPRRVGADLLDPGFRGPVTR